MMSPDPRISVCIPAYNAVAYLRAAVRSVLDQTYQDFEIVIVDDASRDGTMDSIRDLSDPRIRRFSNPSNLGGGANWDRAVERSHGRLIKLLCPHCGAEMKVIAFIEDHKVIDNIIDHLKLRFQAERPPPPQVVQQELLMAAEECGEYF